MDFENFQSVSDQCLSVLKIEESAQFLRRNWNFVSILWIARSSEVIWIIAQDLFKGIWHPPDS
jgi:hypothetical protein